MVNDRKVWRAVESRALITLKEEMKPKFQTMKRNRTLWVELSDKLLKRFGHDRSPAQCAVRWKNIMSAYKDSRDALRNPQPNSKVCSFFKELEAILGDPPLALPPPDDERLQNVQSLHAPSQSPRSRERSSEQKDASVASLLTELITKVDAQGAAIARIEKMLGKAGIVSTPPATDILPSTAPLSVPPPDVVAAPALRTIRPYGTGDNNVLLERPSTTSVPEHAVTPDAPHHASAANSLQVHAVTRPGGAHSTLSLPFAAQARQEFGVTHADGVGDCVKGIVAGDAVSVPVTGHIVPPIQTESVSPSPVLNVAGRFGADGTIAAEGVGCHGPLATSRHAALTAVEPVATAVSKQSEGQGVTGSLRGRTAVDVRVDGLEKETSTGGRARKKQKLVEIYPSGS